jgi:hypothetical protein
MRQFAVMLLAFVLLGALACGGGTLFISTGSHGTSFIAVSGTVTIVRLTFTSDGQFTVVTLVNAGNAQTFNFCGNTVGQFPPNTFVSVKFTQNGSCNNIVP